MWDCLFLLLARCKRSLQATNIEFPQGQKQRPVEVWAKTKTKTPNRAHPVTERSWPLKNQEPEAALTSERPSLRGATMV